MSLEQHIALLQKIADDLGQRYGLDEFRHPPAQDKDEQQAAMLRGNQ